jgi:hypothetical protein
MKKKLSSGSCFLSCLLLLQGCATAAPTSTNQTGFRLTIELQDGSKIIGKSGDKDFQFRSDMLGEIRLSLEKIRFVECQPKTNAVKLVTANGDTLVVQFAMKEVRVEAAFGNFKLPVNLIKRVQVSAVRQPGQARPGLVAAWFGEGDDKFRNIVVSNSASLVFMQQTRQLTFTVWIKPNSIPSDFPVILSKGGNEPGRIYGGYEFLIADGENDLLFVSGGTEFITRGANGRWIKNHLGEWIHIAFVIDGQTKAAKFYVNGEPTNDEYNEGSRPSEDLNFDLPNNLYIGVPDPASNANRSRFDGEMRDLMLFNRALTAKEIHEDYEAGHSN